MFMYVYIYLFYVNLSICLCQDSFCSIFFGTLISVFFLGGTFVATEPDSKRRRRRRRQDIRHATKESTE